MKNSQTIAILGIGLIGGSLALGIKQRTQGQISILGSCSDAKRALLAQKKGIIDEIIHDTKQLQKADLIILATPIPETLILLKDLSGQKLKKNVLVLDVASVKCVIEETITLINPDFHFIGTHPMAGGEKKGFENADPNLFHNKPWIVTPMNRNSKNDMLFINKIIKKLGGIPKVLPAKLHDEQVAWASHLPLTLSSLIVRTLEENSDWNSVKKLVSTGFRDVTRLASHDPIFKTEVILNNKHNLLKSLNKLKEEIRYFEQLVNLSGKKELYDYFAKAKDIRDGLFNSPIN